MKRQIKGNMLNKSRKDKKEKKGIVLELATHDFNGEVLITKAIEIYEPYADRYRLFIDRELKAEITKEMRKITKKEIEKWLI